MLPQRFQPMLATMAEPFDSPDYTFEIKWDGYRSLGFLESGGTRLQSRNGKDLSRLFPELSRVHQRFQVKGCLVDGEIVAFRDGKPSFLELQKRAQLRNEEQIKNAVKTIPVVYVIFDLLYLDHAPVHPLPLEQRRELLRETFVAQDGQIILAWSVPTEGVAFFRQVTTRGLEGVIAKKNGSPYLPGKRTRYWLKFKQKRQGNFVICGYTLNTTTRGELSSLALGAFHHDRFTLFGLVGTGLNVSELEVIHRELEKLVLPHPTVQTVPPEYRHVIWTHPFIVCEVEYLELTDAGNLRHPVFKRFRPEIPPEDCQFDADYH